VFACFIQSVLRWNPEFWQTKVTPTASFVIQSSIIVRMNNVCVLSKLSLHHYQLVRKLFVIRTPLKNYVEQ
jgi:hypothetical protein